MRIRPGLLRAFAVMALAALVPAEAAEAGAEVRKVFSFDASVGQATLPAKTAPNLLTPSPCRTYTHTAGPNEVAVVSVSGTASPSADSEANLRLAVTRNLPFQPFVAVNLSAQLESMADGTAMASSRARIPLDEGQIYQFGVGFAADVEVQVSAFACQGTVLIYSEEP